MAGARGFDHGIFHDHAGHHDRQRGDPGDERGPQHHTRPDPLGAELIHPRLRRAADHGGAAGRPVRPAHPFRDRAGHLHRRIRVMRLCPGRKPVDRRPHFARGGRGAAYATDARDPHEPVSARATWGSVWNLGRRGRPGHSGRTNTGWRDRHLHRLAVDLFRQCSDRDCRIDCNLCDHSRPAARPPAWLGHRRRDPRDERTVRGDLWSHRR